jgi:hypothetical protein
VNLRDFVNRAIRDFLVGVTEPALGKASFQCSQSSESAGDCFLLPVCSVSFRAFSTTKMRVHLTGQRQGDVRVSADEKVPSACKEYYLAERKRDAKTSQSRRKMIVLNC